MSVNEDLIETGIREATRLGASYVAVKVSDIHLRHLKVEDGRRSIALEDVPGVHVRVIFDNRTWGFASSTDTSEQEVKRLAHSAVKLAKANAIIKKEKIQLAPNDPVQASYKTKIAKDPFKVPEEDVFDLLASSVNEALSQSDYTRNASASAKFQKEQRTLGTTEGALISQELTRTAGSLTATARGNGMIQNAGTGENFATRGYEWIEATNLPEAGREQGRLAAELVEAERCPAEVTSLLIEDRILAMQIHETIGHPTELDRVLQTEVDFAGPIGNSFFSLEALGKLWFGSELINIVADATIPGGDGTFGYDDDGVPAKKTYIVKEGILSGFQSSRETAAEAGLGESSGQCLGTYGFDQPIVRMTNLNLLPGDWTRDELIEDTRDGILMSGYKTEIFDQRRTTFGFGTEKAWRIKNGEIVQLYRDPSYYGVTAPFWRSCDGVSKDNWQVSYGGGCGKCRPGQNGHVGHFCSTARFNNVHVGGGGVVD